MSVLQMRSLSEANIRYMVIHKEFANEGLQEMWRDWFTYDPSYEDDEVMVFHTFPEPGRDFEFQDPITEDIGLIRSSFAPKDTVPGGIVKIDARWASTAAPDQELLVCLNVDGGNTQTLCQAISESLPTSKWGSNEVIRGSHLINIDDDILPGSYNLTLTLIDADLGTTVGAIVDLGTLMVHSTGERNDSPVRWEN